MTKYIYLKMPESHWRQLVSDYEDMCGVGEEEIEILQDYEEFHFDSFGRVCLDVECGVIHG